MKLNLGVSVHSSTILGNRSLVSLVIDDAGAIAMMFAVFSSLLIGAMCLALDSIDNARAQTRTQMVEDVASLAAADDLRHFNGTPTGSDLALWQADVQGYLNSNVPSGSAEVKLPTTNVVATVTGTPGAGQTVSLSLSGTMKLFAPIFLGSSSATTGSGSSQPSDPGNNVTTVSASDSVLRQPQSTLELVMVLDNTGSMGDSADGTPFGASKMSGLQTAARGLVQDLFTQNSTNYYVGLVPFANTVNVLGALLPGGSWLNPSFSYNSTNVQMAGDQAHAGWAGCVVEPRDGNGYLYPKAYSPNDALKFTPYYYNVPPAGLQIRSYNYSFCNNATTTTVLGVPVRLGSNGEPNYCGFSSAAQGTGIGVFYDEMGNGSNGPSLSQNSDCIGQPVTFLTGDQSTLKTAISQMTPSGSTIIPTGLLWGWRMLSSSWSNNLASGNGWISTNPSLPLPENTQALQRVMVVLTDGENQIGAAGTIPNDLYFNGLSGVGSRSLAAPTVVRTDGTSLANGLTDSSELHGGNPSDPSSGNNAGWPDDVNTFQSAVCSAIKKDGVTIYAITFGTGASSTVAQQAMQDCASPGDYYHAPDNATLNTIFQQIAGNLGVLRLIK